MIIDAIFLCQIVTFILLLMRGLDVVVNISMSTWKSIAQYIFRIFLDYLFIMNFVCKEFSFKVMLSILTAWGHP